MGRWNIFVDSHIQSIIFWFLLIFFTLSPLWYPFPFNFSIDSLWINQKGNVKKTRANQLSLWLMYVSIIDKSSNLHGVLYFDNVNMTIAKEVLCTIQKKIKYLNIFSSLSWKRLQHLYLNLRFTIVNQHRHDFSF